VRIGAEPSWWRNLSFQSPTKRDVLSRPDMQESLLALAVSMPRFVRDALGPALLGGQALKGMAGREGEVPGAACFIPVLVVAVFREIESLIRLVSALPCRVGAVVVRSVGPHAQSRNKVEEIFGPLQELLSREQQGNGSHVPRSACSPVPPGTFVWHKRCFILETFDSAQLPIEMVSIGGAFNDAVLAGQVFDDVLGRPARNPATYFSELSSSSSSPTRLSEAAASLADVCAAASSAGAAGSRWKRWALFVDSEQDLSSPDRLADLASHMNRQVAGEAGCRASTLVVVAPNFFALSMVALQRVGAGGSPPFAALWGYADVTASIERLLGPANHSGGSAARFVVDRERFRDVSTGSGYDRRRLDPFAP
jgi:hypothetical protein